MKKLLLPLAMFGVLLAGSFQLMATSSANDLDCHYLCYQDYQDCVRYTPVRLCAIAANACNLACP